MSRRALWITAALLAAVAAALTAWFTGPSGESPEVKRTRHGWRTGRLTPLTGGESPIPTRHPRVAALAPGIAQIVRDLGCGSLIVGRHSYDAWTDQSIPKCADQQGIDYEALIAANPTHVLLEWGKRELPERLTALARERGWVVSSYPLLTLDDVGHATVAISGAVVTDELAALRADDAVLKPPATPSPQQIEREKALQVAPYKLSERLDRAYRNNPALAGAGRVLLLSQEVGENGRAGHPAALGPGSYSHDILVRIGGKTATQAGKAFMPMDAEDVAAIAPEAIVIIRPRRPDAPAGSPAPGVDELLRSLGPLARLDIPAVKAKRVALIDDPMALVPGTNLPSFADALRAILSEWSRSQPPAAP
jgi:ABC-type hemin transport system substrate-binding protein